MFSALPTTSQYIQFHATMRPRAWALHCAQEDISYAQLNRDLKLITEHLVDVTRACDKQSIVEVCIDDTYLNWLVLLGLENLGLCSSSVVAVDHIHSVTDLWPVSLILCTEKTFAKKVIRTECLDRAILKAKGSPSDVWTTSVHHELSTVLRMLKTSGTTGSPKRIALTRNMFEGWVNRWNWFCRYNAESVCWMRAPFSVGGMYASATACLRAGGAVVLNEMRSFHDALIGYGVTHATLLPIELTQILVHSPQHRTPHKKIMLTLFGGAISQADFDQALSTFAHDVVDMYGTNEVGFIGLRRRARGEEGLLVFPGVQIDICDEQEQSLPVGAEGHVRVRTVHMAPEYVDAKTLKTDNFKNGWFWPGDLGELTPAGLLKLSGRHDDLLNMGGVKVNPVAMEAEFIKLPFLSDVAMVMNSTEGQGDVITIAIVPTEPESLSKMQALVAANLKAASNFMLVQAVPSIPRTVTGKVERQKLRDMLKQTAE